ncbi:helix-turn-helix transcriptional regulator [Streptomyces sp. NRAIS4]
MPGPAADLGLASYATSAQLKIAAALPAPVSDHAARIGARFLIDGDSWRPAAPDAGQLPLLAQAVKDEQALEVRFRTPGADADEIWALSPYGMVLDAGAWHLVAARTPGTEPSVLPVSWIHAAAPSLHDFRPATGLDLRAFWTSRGRHTDG